MTETTSVHEHRVNPTFTAPGYSLLFDEITSPVRHDPEKKLYPIYPLTTNDYNTATWGT